MAIGKKLLRMLSQLIVVIDFAETGIQDQILSNYVAAYCVRKWSPVKIRAAEEGFTYFSTTDSTSLVLY